MMSTVGCIMAQEPAPQKKAPLVSNWKENLKKGAQVTGLAAIAIPAGLVLGIAIRSDIKKIYKGKAYKLYDKKEMWQVWTGILCGYALYQSIKDIKNIVAKKNNAKK